MNLLEAKTVQSGAFRLMGEALKEFLTDIIIEWDKTGAKIIAMDPTHTVLVHLRLFADKFEIYNCSKKLKIGINMLNFFRIIKTITNNDTLTLFMNEENTNTLGIRIENAEKNLVTNYKLNLLDLNEDTIKIPPTTFDSVITMPSTDFQKICRDMFALSDILEIKSMGQQLMFSCTGDFASQETILGETNNGLKYVQNDNPGDIIQGIFSLKNLVLFTKCTNLCNTIKMYIKNDYPLIIEYSVASVGIIKLCLAPKVT